MALIMEMCRHFAFSTRTEIRFAISSASVRRSQSTIGLATTPRCGAFNAMGWSSALVGCAVGAPFAVLLAEQMFASGCRFLISITSSGQITPVGETPYYILIDRALRDQGTSYHYLPPSRFADVDPEVLSRLAALVGAAPPAVFRGAAWTTDAPYRETEEAIAAHRDAGILAVEMEAAALYAFSRARGHPVACFAHVTNTMAQTTGDFEKGEADGALDSLLLATTAAKAWLG